MFLQQSELITALSFAFRSRHVSEQLQTYKPTDRQAKSITLLVHIVMHEHALQVLSCHYYRTLLKALSSIADIL